MEAVSWLRREKRGMGLKVSRLCFRFGCLYPGRW
jgi:hypothetical protein